MIITIKGLLPCAETAHHAWRDWNLKQFLGVVEEDKLRAAKAASTGSSQPR